MMNVNEKRAWFILVVFGATLILYLGLMSWLGPEAAFVAFLLCFSLFFTPLIGHRDRKLGKVDLDERDDEIGKTAQRAAFGALWGIFLTGMMLPFCILGPDETITVRATTFTMLLGPATMIVGSVYSIVTIVMYRRG
jgi:hypothetical protein